MLEPRFPKHLRIVVEPFKGVFLSGFSWQIQGSDDGEEWHSYWYGWGDGFADMDRYNGWKRTAHKAEAKARKVLCEVIESQAKRAANYSNWLEGRTVIVYDGFCDD